MRSAYDPARIAAATEPVPNTRRDHYPLLDGQTTHPHAPYACRLDPYHNTQLWHEPPGTSPRLNRASVNTTTTTRRRSRALHEPLDPDVHTRDWRRMLRSPIVHRTVASLLQFRHATGPQLCCLLKLDPTNQHDYLRPLFDFGIVARGVFRTPGRSGRTPYIYSLADSATLHRYLHELPDEVRTGILAGHDRPTFAERHIRHNILVAEATLRTIETDVMITHVDGEHSAGLHQLLGKHTPTSYRSMHADAVWWREDGLRIVVELAASTNWEHIRRRLTRWAQLLVTLPREHTNLVVVWLVAVNDDHDKVLRRTRRTYEKILELGTTDRIGGEVASPNMLARARRQLTIASWQDWYPTPYDVSEAGRDLVAAAPINGDRWHVLDLTNPNVYDPPTSPAPTPTWHLGSPTWAGDLPAHFPDDDTTKLAGVAGTAGH